MADTPTIANNEKNNPRRHIVDDNAQLPVCSNAVYSNKDSMSHLFNYTGLGDPNLGRTTELCVCEQPV